MDISVVIPLYNEAESLPELYAWIERVMKEHGFSYEVIFVNDGSTDESWKVISDLAAKSDCVKGIKFRRNYGKSPALYCGFEQAQGDVVITMDADLPWMDAHKAMELGFADGILQREDASEGEDIGAPEVSMLYSRAAVTNSLMDKIAAKCRITKQEQEKVGFTAKVPENEEAGSENRTGTKVEQAVNVALERSRKADEIRERLDFIKRFI